jgi:uncharacterized phage protein gp47/JayE
MALPVLTFNQYLENILNALATSTAKITNLRAGSIALAFAQAITGNSMAIQQLIVHVANITRLGTSTGSDVDSFVADYGLTRLPAVASTGNITMTRGITGTTLSVPITGSVAQTPIGLIGFDLVADPTNPKYNIMTQSYVFGTSDSSILAKVQCVTPGLIGDITANQLTQIVSGFGGVNSITNLLPFGGGADQETDAELKVRFREFISSLAECTESAFEFAINSVQAGLTFQLIEQFHFDGTPFPGGVTIVVDDGSGAISPTLLTTIFNALKPVHAAGIGYEVDAPTNETVGVTVTVQPAGGFDPGTVFAAVQAAIIAYINTLGVGVTVSFVQMNNVVQGVPGVFEYSALLINGSNVDVVITDTELARAGTVTVTAA